VTGAGTALFLVAICVLPALAFLGLERAFDWVVSHEPRRRRPPVDPAAMLPALAADLRRLSAEHDRLVGADVPGKLARLRAVQLAYDDTLLRAGAVLAVDLPPAPLSTTTRLQAEAELAAHGFDW
jgi:hypothetical protein